MRTFLNIFVSSFVFDYENVDYLFIQMTAQIGQVAEKDFKLTTEMANDYFRPSGH